MTMWGIERLVKPRNQTVDLTVQEAYAAVLLGAVTSDGKVSLDEGRRVHGSLTSMSLYRRLPLEELQAVVGKVMALIEYYGVAPVVAWAAAALPRDLRTTAFANAADLVLSDSHVKGHERSFLDELQAVLQLDEGTTARIVEVMSAKNRG
jgi:hypothetical protein